MIIGLAKVEEENGHKAWVYKYMNHLFLAALVGLLSLVIALVGRGVNDNLGLIYSKIDKVQAITEKHEEKINAVCQDIQTHSLLMGLPYKERKELMQSIKKRIRILEHEGADKG